MLIESSDPAPRPTRGTFLNKVLTSARALGPRTVGLVYPCDRSSLETALAVVEQGLAQVTLIGPRDQIIQLADSHGIDLSCFQLLECGPDAAEAAAVACRLASTGEADMLMKGSLHSDELIRAVVSRTGGLRGGGRIAHAFVLEVPGREQPLIISDCVVNVAPTLPEKVEILAHAVALAQALDIVQPRVAVISFTESVSFGAQSTLDAAVIAKMAERGQIQGALVDGPLAFDNAVSLAAAAAKRIESRVAGQADILLMPNLETGNALYKSLIYMAGATCAGILLGTAKPVILTSRAESMECKVFSVALGSLMLRHAQ